MTDVKLALPKPEIRGIGKIMYRCAACGELLEPAEAVLVDDLSYHPDHAPEMTNGR